jgi:hypothetical protein
MMIKKDIENYMWNNYKEHLDSSNCLIMITLAEDAYNALDPEADLYIPDIYLEVALQLQDDLIKRGLINE